MSQGDKQYSTENITPQLISQIVESIRNKAYGSVEIYIQNHNVVQITERTITKMVAAQIHRNGFKKSRFKVRITSTPEQSSALSEPSNS